MQPEPAMALAERVFDHTLNDPIEVTDALVDVINRCRQKGTITLWGWWGGNYQHVHVTDNLWQALQYARSTYLKMKKYDDMLEDMYEGDKPSLKLAIGCTAMESSDQRTAIELGAWLQTI